MLYVLRRLGRVGYDETAGQVIRAGSEQEARKMAAEACGPWCEAPEEWLHPSRSSCEVLEAVGEPSYIMVDFRHG